MIFVREKNDTNQHKTSKKNKHNNEKKYISDHRDGAKE